MAVTLSNGSTVHIATQLADEKKITAITNAVEAVATSTSHGLENNDYIVLNSGWGILNERVYRVQKVDNNSFKLEKIDTTDMNKFPAGSGAGSFQKVSSWQQITQIMEFSTSGGEQQFYDFGFLEDDYDRQIPTTQSAVSISMTIADDPSLMGYKALEKASDSGKQTPLRVNLKSGSTVVFNGYVSLNKMPSMTRNEGMTVSATYSLGARFNRYS